jgi:hypothetical protein
MAPSGEVVGFYEPDAHVKGFVRNREGHVISFYAPGSLLTVPVGISAEGQILGRFADASGVFHAFLRNANGSFTIFDVSGAIQTSPYAINPSGEATGQYVDANFMVHGFVRSRETKSHD